MYQRRLENEAPGRNLLDGTNVIEDTQTYSKNTANVKVKLKSILKDISNTPIPKPKRKKRQANRCFRRKCNQVLSI